MKLKVSLRKLVGRRRRATDRISAFATVIGSGMQLSGALRCHGNTLVCGQVAANVELEGSLVLLAGAHWHGNIVATNVLIAGEVVGDITARVKLELAASARVSGNLISPGIAIAKGAVYEGKIQSPRNTHKTYFNERRSEAMTRLTLRAAY